MGVGSYRSRSVMESLEPEVVCSTNFVVPLRGVCLTLLEVQERFASVEPEETLVTRISRDSGEAASAGVTLAQLLGVMFRRYGELVYRSCGTSYFFGKMPFAVTVEQSRSL